MDYYTTTGNDYSTVGAAFGAATGVFFGIFVFALVIAIALAIVLIIAKWKINAKAHQPGWAALIPFYDQYILCKIVGISPWWVLIVVCAGLINAVPVIGQLAYIVTIIYFDVLLNVSLARAFGKEDTFAIGLILVPIVFYPMLGFGKSEYVGAKPMNDIIFKNNNQNSGTNQQVNNNEVNPVVNNNVSTESTVSNDTVQTGTKFCPNCGASVEADTKFCSSCGGEIK